MCYRACSLMSGTRTSQIATEKSSWLIEACRLFECAASTAWSLHSSARIDSIDRATAGLAFPLFVPSDCSSLLSHSLTHRPFDLDHDSSTCSRSVYYAPLKRLAFFFPSALWDSHRAEAIRAPAQLLRPSLTARPRCSKPGA